MIIRSVLMHRCGRSEGCLGTRRGGGYVCVRARVCGRGIELDDDFEIHHRVFHL